MSKRRSIVRGAVIVVATVTVTLGVTAGAGEGASAPNPCSLSGVTPPATYDHVVVIFEENASYGRVVGNADAPYFNQLAGQCALATNYHEVAGVSQPNYMAATGGQATGVGVKVNAPSIFSQAPSWLELQESMGSNCGGKSTFYKRGHDPAFWYTPIAAQCKVNDIPAATSASGLTTIPSAPRLHVHHPEPVPQQPLAQGMPAAEHGLGQPAGDGHVAPGNGADDREHRRLSVRTDAHPDLVR